MNRVLTIGRAVWNIARQAILLVSGRETAAEYWRAVLTTVAQRPPSDRIPVICRESFAPGITSVPVTLDEYVYRVGTMPLHEIAFLCRMVRTLEPKQIFEFGTYLGETSRQLASNCQAKIITLDLESPASSLGEHWIGWGGEVMVNPTAPGERVAALVGEGQVIQLLGNSLEFDERPYLGAIDMVIVDASHEEQFVRSDSAKALRMLAPGGLLVWHDCAPYEPDVEKVIGELAKKIPIFRIEGTTFAAYASVNARHKE